MLKANWIQPKGGAWENCPLFKKEFRVSGDVKSAVLKASARGVYKAELNGKRVGNFIMAPGWTSYKKRIQFQEYDVTDMLLENNSIVIQLGPGWYGLFKYPHLAVIAELTVAYTDGRVDIIATDSDWLVSQSGYELCHIYDGMKFDATKQLCFDEKAELSEMNDISVLVPQISEPVTEQERLKPVEIITTPRGETVIDFGQNMTGYLEISVEAHKGDKLSFSFAEILDKDGNFYNENYRKAKCFYEYICKEGQQTFKPELTFYGFRYVRVDDYPYEVSPENFTAVVVHTDMKRTGRIETSEPLLNQLFHNIIWGQKSNYLDIPTDCPQRDERLGWTGDAQVFVKAASYNFDVLKFFIKWLGDMKLDQDPDGSLSNQIPKIWNSQRAGSAAWGDAITICPWQIYLTYGDINILKMMFEPMKKWVDHITLYTTKENLWFGGRHYGDWLELKCKYGECKGYTRDDLIASAFYAYSTELVCKAGRVLGEDISEYEELHKRIVAAFKAEFKDEFKTQTEYVLALHFGLTDRPEETAERLVQMIHSDGDMLQTGFVGTPYLLHVLSRFGYTELAYKLLLRTEYPSWLYPISKGATTMWEHWDGIKPDGDIWPASMNSFNHYAYGAVGDWMYSVCAGINPIEEAPGFEKVLIAPIPDNRIKWFKAELDTAHGTVKSGWRHENGKTVYEITTPVSAEVVISGKRYELQPGSYVL